MYQSISSLKILLIITICISAVLANNTALPEIGRPRLFLEGSLIIVFFISSTLIIRDLKFPIIPHVLVFILLVSTLSSAINSIVIEDLRPFRTYLLTNISILGIYLLFVDRKLYLKKERITKFIIIFATIPFYLSFLFVSLTLYRYQGILDDSQSMGRVSGYLIILLISYFLFFKKNFFMNFFLLSSLVLALIILFATNSRTPLFIFLLYIIPLIILLNAKGVINIFRFIRIDVKYYIIFFLLIFSIFYYLNKFFYSGTPIFSNLYENFQYQFDRYPGTYGTSGRTVRWENAISDYFLFLALKNTTICRFLNLRYTIII